MNLYKKFFLVFLTVGISIGMIMGILFSFQHGIRFVMVFVAIGAVFGLFGGVVSLPLVFLHSWTVKRMPSGITEESIGVHHIRSIELNLPYDMAFNLCIQSLSLIKNCKVQKEDRTLGKILGKAGMTWKTFGDIIAFDLSKNANNEVRVEVSSKPVVRTTLIDYGKNLDNVDKIIEFLNAHAEDLVISVDQARKQRQVHGVTAGVNSSFAVENVQKAQLKNEFALEKNATSLIALIIMASMLIYALVDTVFINLYEIVGYPENKLLLIALSAMPICLLGFVMHGYMIRSSVPERETMVLTILCVLSLAIAAHPILQRIDSIIASKPMQIYTYRMIKPGVFEPIEIGPPKLKLRTQCEYWQQYAVNTTLQFSLQHGGLGMWQLDGEALDKDIYAYLKKLHPTNFIGNFRIK